MSILLKVFALKPSLLVAAAVGEPKFLEELVFILFFFVACRFFCHSSTLGFIFSCLFLEQGRELRG